MVILIGYLREGFCLESGGTEKFFDLGDDRYGVF